MRGISLGSEGGGWSGLTGVDSGGRVHGIEGLHVADASIMPAVTSGNTNMPTAVIGEKIARSLLSLTQPVADGGGYSVPA